VPSASFEQNLKAKFSKTSETKKPTDSTLEQIYPVDKKPHQRSKKPLHRIDIVDVETDATVTSESLVDVDGQKFSEKLLTSSGDGKGNKVSTDLIDKIEVISSTEAAHEAGETQQVIEEKKGEKKSVGGLQKKVEDEIMSTMSNKLSIADENDCSIKFKNPPKSSVQFISEWKQLKTNESRSKYIRLLHDPARDYVKVFKHSMESNIFTSLVDIFSCSDIFTDPVEISQHLLGISRVPRITALVMFLSSGEKRILQELIDKNVRPNSVLKEQEKNEILKAFC
jgi:Potential Monad-binding region of RPAP3